MNFPEMLDLAAIRELYDRGISPFALLAEVQRRIAAGDPAAFITIASKEHVAAAITGLLHRAPEPGSLPLWGVPFAVKDNIDVAGLPTTCACPEFTRIPEVDATVVAKLVAAGAICVGKTNLDQFATGLNGTRSPYGAPRSVFRSDHISGGSSSGSAVAVASGMVPIALGTDTAASGRVPAMLNNIVGLKPTPGLLSTGGLVPACESLDCISIFALNVADARLVRKQVEGHDPADPWSRRDVPVWAPADAAKVGVLAPEDRQFFGAEENADLYADAIARSGCQAVAIDYAPFREVAALLYESAWVAERQCAFAATGLPEAVLDPSLRTIFAKSSGFDAAETFAALHRLKALQRRCEEEMARVDFLLLPTAPRSWTVAEMLEEPIARNTTLGTYTNFCNLLGQSAIAVPAGFTSSGLPFGVTLVGPALADDALLPLAQKLHVTSRCGAGKWRDAAVPPLVIEEPEGNCIEMAVVGAHLSGMTLNRELLALGAELVGAFRTTGEYRLFVLPDTSPAKPGMVRVPGSSGSGIGLEVWSMSAAAFGAFTAAIPSPLGIGKIVLANGKQVSGFLCEAWAVENAREITEYGGWRAYIEEGAQKGTEPAQAG